MFGVRLNQVFASRWKALLWAAGVLMTAYCTVPDRETEEEKAQDRQVIVIPDPATEKPAME